MDQLGASRICQPARHRFVVGRGQDTRIDKRLRPFGGCKADAPQIARPAPPTADERKRHLSCGVLLQPGCDLAGCQSLSGDSKCFLGVVLFVTGAPIQLGESLPQGAELEGGEQLGCGFLVPLTPLGLLEPYREFQVPQQTVQTPVTPYVVEVLPQRLSRLARNLFGTLDDVRKTIVGVDPLGRGLGPDAGNPWQIVAGLPHQRRQLRVALRWHEVLLLHHRGGHPHQIAYSLARIQHGGAVSHQLQGITITR